MSEQTKKQPALTPEEWRDTGAGHDWRAVTIEGGEVAVHGEMQTISVPSELRHALAALALHGQPFGFTHEMVDALEDALATSVDSYAGTGLHDTSHAAAALAITNLRSLLPPRENAGE
jgi:hypothetical protein